LENSHHLDHVNGGYFEIESIDFVEKAVLSYTKVVKIKILNTGLTGK